ncbi:helix-turn-helix domain-containing protein [Dongia sp.]|uniref:helix-turn-helix domain-containing protein n=1 Tax=Dongia sp. TaxID=1977262 RepID=UPI0035B36E1D
MDSLITAAARALGRGDPLGALDRVALRDDPPALALRGIALAQLGDFPRAKLLLRRAARAFGAKEAVARARCVVAEAEVALAARDLAWPTKSLEAARRLLADHGDAVNAAHARHIALRRHLLLGELDAAERQLQAQSPADLQPADLPPALRAAHELAAAGIAIRRMKSAPARQALARAARAAESARIPALIAEVENAGAMLAAPAARQLMPQPERLLDLAGVEKLLASDAFIVDACRRVVVQGKSQVALARRPVLFTLVEALAAASPQPVPRDRLIALAFGGREADESHRARLRVEIGRLRALLKHLCRIDATADGFALAPSAGKIVLLARPVDEKHASVLALLADGEAWSSSALALALNNSQRSVQRALDALAAAGKVQFIGLGRARRWLASPLPGFTTSLLLTAPLPSD